MKKLFLSLVIAMIAVTDSMAQTDLVATLSHESNISAYYGADALSEAYEAAVDGDVITLSSGTFNAVNIEKAITLRGAGMIGLSNGMEPTWLDGAFEITASATLDGVCCFSRVTINSTGIKPVNISKCRFAYEVNCSSNTNFIHCFLNGRNGSNVCGLQTSGIISIHCVNCTLLLGGSRYATGQYDNCVIAGQPRCLYNANLRNCLIADYGKPGSTYGLLTSTTANYCVAYYYDSGSKGTAFDGLAGEHNTCTSQGETIFKTFGGYSSSEAETFELTDEAAATYLGDDGKQVGIYGGTNPFDPTPTNPQITKFTVDKSVSNGKLSVKINVE